jgi:hypothetical protein
MPGGYVVRDANGQALAYLYSRDNDAEARRAKVLTRDEARRIAGTAGEGGARLNPGQIYAILKAVIVNSDDKSPAGLGWLHVGRAR